MGELERLFSILEELRKEKENFKKNILEEGPSLSIYFWFPFRGIQFKKQIYS